MNYQDRANLRIKHKATTLFIPVPLMSMWGDVVVEVSKLLRIPSENLALCSTVEGDIICPQTIIDEDQVAFVCTRNGKDDPFLKPNVSPQSFKVSESYPQLPPALVDYINELKPTPTAA